MANPIWYYTETGTGYSPDGTLPSGAVECTQEQARGGGYSIQNGALVANPAPNIAQLQTTQIATLNAACQATILAGFQTTLDGTATTITLDQQDQFNANANASTAQAALQSSAWAANTTYAANSLIVVGGVVLVTLGGGTSGTTAPVAPTAFQTAVTDNEVTWYKLGFWVGTGAGNVMVDPPTMIQLFGQGVAWVNACRSKYEMFKAQVMAATTTAAVLAVVWA